ncbi:MAG: hypothetical protein QOG67_17 [Verrucomicrobiota bacterium]|jgi:hypothetical protein
MLVCLCCVTCAQNRPSRIGVLPPGAFLVSEDILSRVIQPDGSIPERYWGAPIRALKPLRVYEDRVNIVVATNRTRHQEHGVYFCRPISSYLPRDGDGWKFRRNQKTGYLEYVFTKEASPLASKNL